MTSFTVPGAEFATATQEDYELYQLFGGHRIDEVGFTREQMKHLQHFYGFDSTHAGLIAASRKLHDEHVARYKEDQERVRDEGRYATARVKNPGAFNKEGLIKFLGGGADRNMLRDIRREGLRIMALLAPFLEPGEDPVVLVAKLCAQAGYEVSVPDDECDDYCKRSKEKNE